MDCKSISLPFGKHGPEELEIVGRDCSLDCALFVKWTGYQTSWDICSGFTQPSISHLVCLANATALWFDLGFVGMTESLVPPVAPGLPFVRAVQACSDLLWSLSKQTLSLYLFFRSCLVSASL